MEDLPIQVQAQAHPQTRYIQGELIQVVEAPAQTLLLVRQVAAVVAAAPAAVAVVQLALHPISISQ